MLRSTFIHIPGVGVHTERRLWSAGILSWDDFSEHPPIPLTRTRTDSITHHLERSKEELEIRNPKYFERSLSSNQLWRLFPEFRRSVAYLDIETTGLDAWRSYITTIALYDGRSIFHYVNGENLDDFREDIAQYEVIVTYNGRCFDVPFIRSYLGIEMNQVHIDLRYVLKSLGYGGGLKGCEKQLAIDRGDLDGVDGFFAVLLWSDFIKNKNQKALETLLAYNIQDVVNLETLMVISYNLKLRDTPFPVSHRLSIPICPPNPFHADRHTIERIRRIKMSPL